MRMWFIKSHPISAQVGMDVRAENTKLIRSVAFAVASICDLDHIFLKILVVTSSCPS